METPLYALTVWQPWSSLIAVGLKTHEFRMRAPWRRLIGQRIAIHAAARKPRMRDCAALARGPQSVMDAELQTALGFDIKEIRGLAATTALENYPLGAFVATARLGESLTPHDVARLLGSQVEYPHEHFNWAWPMEDVCKLPEPIACKGAQGFWAVPPGIAMHIEHMLGKQA